MAELTFHWATESDVSEVAEIVELVQAAYRGESKAGSWTTEADLMAGQRIDTAMLRGVLAEAGVLLATDDGRLVACCELRAPDAPGGVGYFGMFAVRPGLQGNGLGRRVLARAEEVARTELGAGALELTVINVRAELIAWYERRGYRRTGQIRPFPYDDERYGRPQRPDLEFVTLAKQL